MSYICGEIQLIMMDKDNIASEPAVAYTFGPALSTILGGQIDAVDSRDTSALIALTRDGIKVSSLKSLADYLGVTMEQLSSFLNSSYRNLQRKDDDEHLDPLKTEKVLELAAFVQRGCVVLGGRQPFKTWLHSSLMVLDYQKPVDYIDTSFGIGLLLRILGRIEQGVYS
jgi:putative toxin-antitoxin system antitoxin component (TIGR02293 family)